MACTIEELQKVEYDILCSFDDFCKEYSIKYTLFGGTLLGAIRHNGFIPWDDDLDICMDSVDFKRFIKKIKKHPIPGIHFSWVDTDNQHPFYFAKLRKCGTYMPENHLKSFDINNGVWIDIFCYTGYPKNRIIAAFQEKIYKVFVLLSKIKIYNEIDENNKSVTNYSLGYRIINKLSDKTNGKIRSFLFNIYTSLGSKKSQYVVFNDWSINPKPPVLREDYTPTCKHIFNDKEFSIPVNYDNDLKNWYGDYMTPKVYPSHTDFSKIEL